MRHISYSSRGAFAKRFLPKDSIVAPVPVIQLHIQQVYSEQAGFQLLYNYAFGHPTSNILLLPSRSTGRNRRNAKIRQAEITISIYKCLIAIAVETSSSFTKPNNKTLEKED